MRAIKEKVGENVNCIFSNGAEGDYEVFSTRYSEEAADVLIDASLKQIIRLS